jgi:3-hydroxybutyryl-CoA dehydrogenase
LKPLARITGYATGGGEPKRLFYAPVVAVRKLLQLTGKPLDSYDLIEANEAFAVQALADGQELGWDWNRVNVNGGAVALGHPIGASGAARAGHAAARARGPRRQVGNRHALPRRRQRGRARGRARLVGRIAVVGGGTMGNGIAQVFAAKGHDVTLLEVDDARIEKAQGAIKSSLDRIVKKGTLSESERDATLGRIRGTTSPEDLAGVELAVEAVLENLAVKTALFRKLDAILPTDAILASNTSSISITELAAVTGRADRVIGMHFMNPVPVMALVEIIRGLATSDATYARVRQWTEELGKTPVEVMDYPGFVSNRVLMPMINEAVFCLMEGVASREAIDSVMKLGMNHPLGPLALADLIGLDVCLNIMNVLHDGLGDSKYRALPAAAQDGRGRTARPEVGRRLLRLRGGMNFELSPEHAALRARARAFADRDASRPLPRSMTSRAFPPSTSPNSHRYGLLTPHWPWPTAPGPTAARHAGLCARARGARARLAGARDRRLGACLAGRPVAPCVRLARRRRLRGCRAWRAARCWARSP